MFAKSIYDAGIVLLLREMLGDSALSHAPRALQQGRIPVAIVALPSKQLFIGFSFEHKSSSICNNAVFAKQYKTISYVFARLQDMICSVFARLEVWRGLFAKLVAWPQQLGRFGTPEAVFSAGSRGLVPFRGEISSLIPAVGQS